MSVIEQAIEAFVASWQASEDERFARNYSHVESKPFEVKRNRRYVKITRDNSVEAFIDFETGDVFKAAGWNAPAKHVRGNVLSESGGMEAISGGSVRYLR